MAVDGQVAHVLEALLALQQVNRDTDEDAEEDQQGQGREDRDMHGRHDVTQFHCQRPSGWLFLGNTLLGMSVTGGALVARGSLAGGAAGSFLMSVPRRCKYAISAMIFFCSNPRGPPCVCTSSLICRA